jgi:hypothetical protein
MERSIVVLKSFKGFLKDIEVFTPDPAQAVWFSSVEAAGAALRQVSQKLSTQCWIDEESIKFPRETPYPSLVTTSGTPFY